MAQSLSAPEGAHKPRPGVGKVLTREERGALLNHHMRLLRQAAAEVEKQRGPFDAAKQALTSRFNAAKSDLGKTYTRKYLQSLMDDFGARTRDLAVTERQRFEDRQDLALPVFGEQRDLFGDAETDTERDAIAAEIDGFRAGRRGEDAEVPSEFSMFSQEWLCGYHRGVSAIAELMAQGEAIIAARSAPEDDEAEDEEEEFDADKAARKLRNDPSFMDRSAPAEHIEPQPAEGYPEPEPEAEPAAEAAEAA